jgi:hypothetical protein
VNTRIFVVGAAALALSACHAHMVGLKTVDEARAERAQVVAACDPILGITRIAIATNVPPSVKQ